MIVDHFYFCTDKPDLVAHELLRFGLTEGAPNTHPGQGTANRRFFFQNSMLEVLYVSNREEMTTERTKVLGIAEQFDNPRRSKIGIVFRPSEGETDRCPFASSEYRPLYLPENLFMNVASGTYDSEPKFIFLGFAKTPADREEVFHVIDGKKVRKVTKITLCLDAGETSETLKTIQKASNLLVETGAENLLEIEFDEGAEGKSRDFRPVIPLKINL